MKNKQTQKGTIQMKQLRTNNTDTMKILNSYILTALVAALALSCMQFAQADVVFQFTESGGNVSMTSSGTLDTSKLVLSTLPDGWGGTGIEDNPTPGDIDIMGGNSFGDIDISFGFHPGTDTSAITNPGGPFTFTDLFSWTVTSGSKSFTTYSGFVGAFRQAGIGMISADISGGFWSPDQNWTSFGATFASLGLNVGTYSVIDSETGETITIQVGGQVGDLTLGARVKTGHGTNKVLLKWDPADGGKVQVFRNGVSRGVTADDGKAKDVLGNLTGDFTFQVCETDSGDCSNEVTVTVP
jgi:hypothetical protein